MELGDPPMGVAFGRFGASPEYRKVYAQASSNLTARTATGTVLQAWGGVAIQDESAEFGPEEMELVALGISYPEYQTLFPEHVATYERQFARNA
ncbi:hypothetical protein [Chitiniphilus shinanonensis]|uniref:hypothetical protein n=1 Tax=Chitiniphilus shinanonensis TaxID=553088 RepID=UPI003028A0AA